jgi:hypothetical protein
LDIPDYCRQIETYLCGKNDGHLIRVVGPSFEIVSGWAQQGVPLKVAFRGIDRYFERYYAKGPRRRPVKIDFCEADVLAAFDEWRRALGLPQAPAVDRRSSGVGAQPLASGSEPAALRPEPPPPGQSLPAHLERVVLRLSNARAQGVLGSEFDELIDRVARELDEVRASARSLRGDARRTVIARLDRLDAALGAQAGAVVAADVRRAAEREADEELGGYRASMTPEAFGRAREAAIDRLLRERLGLPTIRFV